MTRTKNILILCVMLLMVVIAGCGKEEEKKDKDTLVKAKDSYSIKACNGRNDSKWYAKKSCCFNK